MSNFAQNIASKEKRQSHEWDRRNKLADYVYSLSKLCFGGLVIGEAVYWHNGEFSWQMLIMGIVLSISLAAVGNNILK